MKLIDQVDLFLYLRSGVYSNTTTLPKVSKKYICSKKACGTASTLQEIAVLALYNL